MANAKNKKTPAVLPGSLEYWDLVRQKAYEIWEERCRQSLPGNSYTDWLTAEERVTATCTRPKPPSPPRNYTRRKK